MKEVLELLTEKETELERVRKQVDSLRAVIPLLANDRFEPEPNRKPVSNVQATGRDGLPSSRANSKSSFWSIAKRWRSK
jgi:hypothetical protein